MDTKSAVKALGALSQATRLEVFKLLVRHGNQGLPAGQIARTMETPHNTMSSHLAVLLDAGLVQSRREGRSVIYCVDLEGARALMSFLMEDCCRGSAEICSPILDSIFDQCCA